MIVVTGTHRSGTSMWMQILRAAGLPLLGEAFPHRYSGLTDINPAGFWETRLRTGVNFTSNPDPATGIFLSPEATRHHVLKVFVRGLVRSDLAYLDRVIATVRPWREYVLSLQRLHDAEEAPLLARDTPESARLLHQRRTRRPDHPAAVDWWFQLYALLHDVALRAYPHHLVTFSRLLRNPAAEIEAALQWLGTGELDAAVQAVRPELRTFEQPLVPLPEGLTAEDITCFDAVYAALDEGRDLDGPLIRRANATQASLRARWPSAPRPASWSAAPGSQG